MFVYNFLIMMALDYSLQMAICSYVNVLQYQEVDDAFKVLSYALSLAFLALYVVIVLAVTTVVLR